MFKKILISLVLCIASLNAMQQKESFPFQSLPKDIQTLVLVYAYKDHQTASEAIQKFKALTAVSRNTLSIANSSLYAAPTIMEDLVKKYSSDAIVIPLCLHSKMALEAFKQAFKESLVPLADEIADLSYVLPASDKQQGQAELDSILIFAAICDDFKQVKHALAAGCDLNFRLRAEGSTLFTHIISHVRSCETLKYMLAMGADVNACNEAGLTGFMSACINRENNLSKVKMLLAAGAHVNARDMHGNTSLLYAIRRYETASNTSNSKKLTDDLVRLLYAAGVDAGKPDFQCKKILYRYTLLAKMRKFAQETACTIV